MNTQLPFPGKMFRGADALLCIGEYCNTLGKRVYILGGKTALDKTQEIIQKQMADFNIDVIATDWYGGECSRANIENLADRAMAGKADFILAAGGGKALDTGKAVAAKCLLPIVTVPTIAATCAAITPLTVLYDEKGQFADNLFLTECPVATIIDTTVILGAPSSWLAAGIGDTLAKMYELRAAASRMKPTSLTMAAVSNGQICYDIIKHFGKDALESAENKRHSTALDATVDAIVLFAGMSSIYGGEKLRNAAAHAIYNGFTKVPKSHSVAHGLIVGYGNLCLLALEEKSDQEILEEIKLANRCKIPTTLRQIASLSKEELEIIAEASSKATAMACMPFEVSKEMVINAIKRVDSLAAQV
ncbi:iron-containing alcohol dehydrogenase family protein [Pelosinus sp. UFO1]|uniref:iron-containing alcohol dehydrogenase family protein n=1 Tax=Pelosinus sp. UFO1 TaxID=484770 RepID=UPI0004D1C876|nr:iron-containing alcohol dehydrogenase family protein [Pelosinus sp. UFO1]AIF54198.1 Glycerol dehydrogenase [Pelosinus sp. UFO1]